MKDKIVDSVINGVSIKMHQGQALLRLAETYPTLMSVLLESVQNSLDACATLIKIVIDLQKDRMTTTDNGHGVSESMFLDALHSVAASVKRSGSLGQFGLGLIAGLGKCAEFTFTSTPKSQEENGYRMWRFVTKDVVGMREDVVIPSEKIGLRYHPNPTDTDRVQAQRRKLELVSWRSRMSFSDVITDRRITKMTPDEVVEEILSRFGRVMRERGVTVSLSFTDRDGKSHGVRDFVAAAYSGTPLSEYVVNGDHTNVKFTLFSSRVVGGRRRGVVTFGVSGNDYRITANDFANQAKRLVIQEALEALQSGYFEGEITADKVELLPERTGFVENDAWVEMLTAIDKWWFDVGETHCGSDIDEERQKRYQRSGLVAMEALEQQLKESGAFADFLGQFKVGNIGPGHKTRPSIGEDDVSMITTVGHHEGRSGITSSRERSETENEHTNHHPCGVGGPNGRRRRLVKGGSTGLSFVFDEFETTQKVFRLDPKTGRLSFNTRHPHFEKVERKPLYLVRYILTVAHIALVLEISSDDATRLAREESLLQLLTLEVSSIVSSGGLLHKTRGTSLSK